MSLQWCQWCWHADFGRQGAATWKAQVPIPFLCRSVQSYSFCSSCSFISTLLVPAHTFQGRRRGGGGRCSPPCWDIEGLPGPPQGQGPHLVGRVGWGKTPMRGNTPTLAITMFSAYIVSPEFLRWSRHLGSDLAQVGTSSGEQISIYHVFSFFTINLVRIAPHNFILHSLENNPISKDQCYFNWYICYQCALNFVLSVIKQFCGWHDDELKMASWGKTPTPKVPSGRLAPFHGGRHQSFLMDDCTTKQLEIDKMWVFSIFFASLTLKWPWHDLGVIHQ